MFRNLLLILAAAAMHGSAPASTASLKPCYLAGFSERVECGSVSVPEDRARPDGRKLTIHFARIPALSRPAAPDPVLVLAGGPGQGAMDYSPLLNSTLREARKRRDILLVDQRGTGRSAPLNCKMPADAMAGGDADAQVQAALRECVSKLDADTRHYHLDAALPDFEAIRQQLGYRQLNLWGVSYGTRTALVYARTYPGSVRSMVLDSVAPTNYNVLLSSANVQAALDKLLADCAADRACATTYPALADDMKRLLAMPASGKLQRETVALVIRAALYSPRYASVLPHAIHSAANGKPQPLQGLADATMAWTDNSMSMGLTLSVLCAEEAPFAVPAALQADGRGSFLGDTFGRHWRSWCEAWPHGSANAGYRAPVSSNIPTLLFAGGLDPVTPPATAELAARTLGRSRVLVAQKAGHSFTGEGCAPRLTGAFLEHADPRAIDGACLSSIRRPPFVLSSGSPTL